MSEVAKRPTPQSEVDLAYALRDGHRIAFGPLPSDGRLRVAWTQIALEHAHGKACFNANLGNVSAAASYQGDYYVEPCDERVSRNPDKWKRINMHFRSHARIVAGASDYWAIIGGRYKSVLPLFDAGACSDAAYALSRLGYYTAHEDDYARAMVSLGRYYDAHVAPLLAPPTEDGRDRDTMPEHVPDASGDMRSMLTREDIAAIMGAVAVSLDQLARDVIADLSHPPADDAA